MRDRIIQLIKKYICIYKNKRTMLVYTNTVQRNLYFTGRVIMYHATVNLHFSFVQYIQGFLSALVLSPSISNINITNRPQK